MNSFCILSTTFPNEASAKKVIALLLEERLVACAQMMPIQSFYRWEGKLCDEHEVLVFIKTRTLFFDKIEELLSKHYPYMTPQLLQIPIEKGAKAYLQWMDNEIEDF